MKKKILRLATSVQAAALATFMLAGCGSSSMSSYSADTAEVVTMDSGIAGYGYYNSTEAMADAEYADYEEEAVSAIDGTQNTDSLTLLEEKLVYHCDMEIETLDYEGTVASIKNAITQYGGIIQSENETDSSYNWYYESYQKTSGTMYDYIEIRVPSEKYEDFLAALDGTGRITSKSTYVENISQEYYDTTTQIEALQIQEQNLLDMLEKCETIEDMLAVQEELTTVQYKLNSLQTSKRYMDTDVAYSYVNISIQEVMEYHYESEPVKTNTFFDRLVNTLKSTWVDFLDFLEGLLFLIIRLAPYIIIIAVICFIFRKRIKSLWGRRKNKGKNKEEQSNVEREP